MPGHFRFDADVTISAGPDALSEAHGLANRLAHWTGLLPVQSPSSSYEGSRRIELRIDKDAPRIAPEGYRLSITPELISIRARDNAGLFYGTQTLLQLMPAAALRSSGTRGATLEGESESCLLPCLDLEDAPRFPWRGAMLDVARHFVPIDFLKKFVDLLALHKLNIFHLHLNDDQGWRIEIKRYPRLTSVGGYRAHTIVGPVYQNPIDPDFDASKEQFDGVPHGGWYTQEELRDLVAYAAERHVTVVPEIDMPGHAQAAIAAYPELGNLDIPGKDAEALEVSPRWGIHGCIFNLREGTIEFLQNVLAEVMDIFPSPYIHIGGDEAHKQEWKDSPEARARMKELGLSTVEELQSYFIHRMDDFVAGHGRRIVGWDEILEGGLAPNAVVMSWRGERGGIESAKAGHDVVMSPSEYTYFDYYQSRDQAREPQAFPRGFVPLETVYGYEPIPKDLPAKYAHHVLGTQGQLWSEYMPTSAQVEYMAFPRLCALAEVTWSPREHRDFADFLGRLRSHLTRLDALDVNYRPVSASMANID